MPYTIKDAEREVGDSEDWMVGLKTSIKKHEQIVKGDIDSYPPGVNCGLCLVTKNRNISCPSCPANSICGTSFTIAAPEKTLQALKDLQKETK